MTTFLLEAIPTYLQTNDQLFFILANTGNPRETREIYIKPQTYIRLELLLTSHEWLMNLAALPCMVASITVSSSMRNM